MHPKAKEVYTKNGLEYVVSAEDRTEEMFRGKAQERPIKHRIECIIRQKTGGKEYLIYQETLLSTDYKENRISWFHTVGKYQMPIVHKEYSEEEQKPVAVGVEEFDTVYEFEFTEDKLKELLENTYDHTKFYVSDGNIIYGSFGLEEWKGKDFDALHHKGKTGMEKGTQVVGPTEAKAIHKADKNVSISERIVPPK